MEFIDLTNASEDERYQVKGILCNVSRNLEFTCGNKLNNKFNKSSKERITQNGNSQIEQSNNNSSINYKSNQINKSNYQSSTAQTNSSTSSNLDQSISINNSSTSSNCSSTSSNLKMNGYNNNQYNYYNHPSSNYHHQPHHPNHHADDPHNSNNPHPYNHHPNHYANNHYQPQHPNVHSTRMQPVISYPPHFIQPPHNGALPPADHSSAQYHHSHHKMPYYTTPHHHQFTPNTSSKPFYPTNPAAGPFTPNTVLTSISPIVTSANGLVVTSNPLHPHPEILNQAPLPPSDLVTSNNSNGHQQRTNTSNEPIVHSSPYQVNYNPANGLPSNHHSFMHHPTPYIPNIPNAHFAQPNVPMYFVPLTQFYPPTHYPPHMATAQPATILTTPHHPHQPLATPPISPQNDETSSMNNPMNLETNTEDDKQTPPSTQMNSNDIPVNEGDHEDAKDNEEEKDKETNKDQSTTSNYSFLSPESMEEEIEMSNGKAGDQDEDENEADNELIKSDETESTITNRNDKLAVDDDISTTKNEDTLNESSSLSAVETSTTNNDLLLDENVEVEECQNEVDVEKELDIESIKLNDEEQIKEESIKANSDEDKDDASETSPQITPSQSVETDKEQPQEDDKPKSWADLFKMNYATKPSKIIHFDDSPNANSGLFNTTDFEPLGQQIDSIVKLGTRSLQQQTIKSVPVEEDDIFPKLSKKLKELNLKHSLPLLVPRGFTNQSNWCYINAILQALLYCPPFYNLMREIAETPGIFREKSATPIIDSFAKFFTNFMPNEQLMKRVKTNNQISYDNFPKLEPYEPKCIYNVLGNINNECLKQKQEDAEEFLTAVLNCLHDEMLLLLNYDPKAAHHQHKQQQSSKSSSNGEKTSVGQSSEDQDNGGKQVWKEVKTKHRTFPFTSSNCKNDESQIRDIFGGTMLLVRKAGSDVNHCRQPFFTLKLDIQTDKIRTVEDALRNLTSSESIQGFLCPKTNKAIEASHQTFLEQLPTILVLHLKVHNEDRNGQHRKSLKKINFPIDLEMPKECLTQQDRSKYSKTYKLLAVVHHDGKDAGKGHYFTDIFHIGTSLWLRCDDSKVDSISVNQLMHPSKDSKKIPYLLFYRRCDTLRGGKNS